MATLADVLRQTGYSQDGKLTPVAPTAPTLTTILGEHIRTLPQQIEANQRAMDKTTAGMDKFDIFGKPNPNYYPEAMKEFTQNYLPAFMGATAWHGTPHKILNKFDISKVGTGEGAQAYGHGMYFAENPAVAKEYQKIVQGPESTAQHYLEMYKTPKNAISVLESGLTPNLTAEAKQHSLDAINVLKSGKELKGNLYKVDIPDEYIPNMLDWDKPLSEMTKKEAAIIEPLKQALISRNNPYDPKSFKTIGQIIQSSRGTNPDLEKRLLEAGIPGIKYLDEVSRAKGQGTRNFVVFDPSIVKILEENSKPFTRKELIEQQLNKVVE
jgi:hypothetical protein